MLAECLSAPGAEDVLAKVVGGGGGNTYRGGVVFFCVCVWGGGSGRFWSKYCFFVGEVRRVLE